jgi:SAM-dependent methyltransferase
VPTPQQLVDVMLQMAEVKKGELLYDLGSGDGRLVISAAKNHGARAIGIDIDPERIAEAKNNAAEAKVEDKVEFRQADLFKSNFKDADVITLYLLDELNRRLRPQIFAQVRPGTRIVSHAFSMGDWEADAERTVKIKGSEYNAYFWMVPANMSGRWKVSGDKNAKGMPPAVVVEQTFQKITVRAAEATRCLAKANCTATSSPSR